MGYRELVRRKLLEDVYNRMSEEDRRAYAQLSNHSDVMKALDELKRKADKNHHSWLSDFSANVAGNYFADASIWLLSRLIRKI